MTQIMPPGIVGVAILKFFHFYCKGKGGFKMKKIIFLLVLTLAILAIVIPVNAQSITERGFGIFISVGSEKNPIEGTLILTDDSGQILTPNQGVIEVEQGRSILGQVFINGAKDQKKFEIMWSTMTLVNKESLRPTEFDPTYGWTFKINPEDYAQDWGSRVLNVWVREKGAKKDFIRAIFKITYKKSSIFTTSQLVIKSVPCREKTQPTMSNPGVSNESVEVTNRNFKKILDYVNNHEDRIQNFERWAGEVNKALKKPINQENLVNFSITFTGYCIFPFNFWVKNGVTGEIFAFTATSSVCQMALPVCENYFILFDENGPNKSEHKFYVRSGMKSFLMQMR